MAEEHFIKDREYTGVEHDHTGQHSHIRRLAEANNLIWEWRTDIIPYEEALSSIRAELKENIQ